MSVTLERCRGDAFVARFGANHQRHGDPYEMACMIEVHGTEATVKGVAAPRPAKRRHYRDLTNELAKIGVLTVRIERIRDGKVTEKIWRIG